MFLNKMTPREAAAYCRDQAEGYHLLSLSGHPNISREAASQRQAAYLLAAAMIDQISIPTPQPWPPPEDVQDCLAFNALYGVWASKSKTKSSSWSDRIPYRNAYTHWLPMPEKPEVQV